MTTFLIIATIAAGVYIYALIAFYYGFKNWNPMCGCNSGKCDLPRHRTNSSGWSPDAENIGEPEDYLFSSEGVSGLSPAF